MKVQRYRSIWSILCVGMVLFSLFQKPNSFVQAQRGPVPLFASPAGSGSICSQASPCMADTAISTAVPGGIIYFAAGSYSGTTNSVILVNKSLTLIGGWSGNTTGEPVVNPKINISIINGQSSRRGMVVQGSGISVVVRGFKFMNGQTAGSGGAIYVSSGALILENNRFEDNHSDSYGGAIGVDSPSKVQINRNMFDSNSTGSGGGALMIGSSTDVLISDNTFFGNSASYGGAIHVDQGVVVVQRNVFEYNIGSATVDIFLHEQPFSFMNNMVVSAVNSARRSADKGLNLYVDSATPGVISIYYNTFSDLSTCMATSPVAKVMAINNIFAFSSKSIDAQGTDVSGSHNLFYNNTADPTTLTSPILANPAFIDRPSGNYHIGPTSAALDAGANLAVTTDFEGHHRPTGLGYDIGADERCFPAYIPILFK